MVEDRRPTSPDGSGYLPKVEHQSTRVAATRVRGDRCEADWIGQRGGPLQPWKTDCRHGGADDRQRHTQEGWKRGSSLPSPIKRKPNAVRFWTRKAPAEQRCTIPFAHDKGASAPRASAPPVGTASRPGRRQSHSLRQQSHRPVRWLGPASSGVYPQRGARLFRRRVHRYRIPSTANGLLTSQPALQARRPLQPNGSTSINGTATSAIRWSNDLPPASRITAYAGRAHRRRERASCRVPQGAEVCPAVGSNRRGRDLASFALGRRRRCAG